MLNDVDNNQNSSTHQNNIGNGGTDDTTNTNTTFDGKPASDFRCIYPRHRNEAPQIILKFLRAQHVSQRHNGFVGKHRRNRKVSSQRDDEFFITLNACECIGLRTKRVLSNISDVGEWSIHTESLSVKRRGADINDDVVHTALQCLQNIVSDGEKTDSDDALANAVLLDLQTSVIVNACSKAAPLMCHPIQSIRNAAIDFFASAAKKLGPVDTFALLAPIVEPFQRKTVTTLPSSSSSSSPPLSSTDNDREDSAVVGGVFGCIQDPQFTSCFERPTLDRVVRPSSCFFITE